MQQQKSLGSLIKQTIASLCQGLRLTGKHFYASFFKKSIPQAIAQPTYFQQQTGAITLAYPHEKPIVPERGRYKLHNEIDDCIVCDKCVKVCPVDCIEIEAIPAPTIIGKTSNGMSKRIYAAKFDIDMAKCCFCGLCTTVCPTACLTMTPEYDFSVFDFAAHNVGFATMEPKEIKEKKEAWQAHIADKQSTIN